MSEGLAVKDGYDAENMNVVSIEQAPLVPGERVTIVEDHEIFAGESGIVMAVGKHEAYGNQFLFDVWIDGTEEEEAWRFQQHEIAELA